MNENENELRELDAWIALNVMGWTRGDVKPSKWLPDGAKNAWLNPRGALDTMPCYTANDADALKVLQKCSEKVCVRIRKQFSGLYCVWAEESEIDPSSPLPPQPTLPLAIAKFAKLLYSTKG